MCNKEHIRRIIEEGREAFSDGVTIVSEESLHPLQLGVHGKDENVPAVIKTIYKGTKDGYNKAVETFGSMQQEA